MIIESLHIKNFKSHRDTYIDFDTGISIIMGGNGAGKSSILEAISFALFKQHTSKKIDQLITIGQKRMSVEMRFIVNGRKYSILRERTKTSSKALMKVKEGDQFHPLVSGDRQVTTEVQELLEMDGDLFLNAVYVRQGEIADLIEKTPAEKKEMIGRLLGIDSLEKAWKNMKIVLDKYKDKKLRLEGKIESFAELKEELNSKKEQEDNFKIEIKTLNREIEEKIIETKLIQEKKEILDKRGLEFEKNQTLLNSKEQFREQLEKTKKDLDWQLTEITRKEQEIDKLKPKLSRLEVLKSLEEKGKELKNLNKDKERLINILNDIERFEKILTDNEPYYNDYSLLNNDVNSLQYAKDQFEGSRVLSQQYTARKLKVEAKMNEALEKTRDALEKSNHILNTHFTSVEELETHLSTFKPQLEAKLQKTSKNVHEIQKELSNLQVKNQDLEKPIDELEQVKDRCPICKSTITPEKRYELINDYQTDIEANIVRSNDLKEKLMEIEAQKENLDLQQSKIQSINLGILKEYLNSVEEDNKEIESINSNLKELQEKINILEGIEKDIKVKKSQIDGIKGKYENYISVKGSLESLGDIEEHSSHLNEINTSLRDLKKKISVLMDIAGESIENLPEEIVYLEEMNQKYQRLLGELTQKDALIKRQKETEKLIQETLEEIEDINKNIVELKYNEKSHERVKNEWNLKNEELNQLTGKKQLLNGQLDQISISIKELESKIESFQKYKKELNNLKDFLKLLNFIRDLYGKDGVQKDLRNISRPLIEEKTRELFERFNFEYSDIKLDEDYDVTIYGPTGESSLDMISGGEKIAVALALRLGITQVLSGGNLELIMLDEPTIHLDAYRRQELIDLLKKMSIIPQMVIVTHDTDLEDAADNILRIEKEKGTSFLVES
ncbi:AAA family ATPase [Methanobacterium ferruginis]|uniref:AAA family ATPase n=1 Tax=Methanobacterium ferruginis TaxID=710191 RepID=UPI0025743EAA|nr:AAA family ATPase [Methanobacterium ferruginis]BDZ67726.1 double-stranded DNA repair protein Rad50 [Methanobacterium ferruginis]